MAETLARLGVADALVGIDGEMRAMGTRPDGEAWTVPIEAPDPDRRAAHSILALTGSAAFGTTCFSHRGRSAGDLKRQIVAFADHYSHRRYHESIGNLTP